MKIKHGITGNLYAFSPNKKEIIWACKIIGKSRKSIYYSEKYRTWAIRVKSGFHKRALKQIAENDLYNKQLMHEITNIKGKKKG